MSLKKKFIKEFYIWNKLLANIFANWFQYHCLLSLHLILPNIAARYSILTENKSNIKYWRIVLIHIIIFTIHINIFMMCTNYSSQVLGSHKNIRSIQHCMTRKVFCFFPSTNWCWIQIQDNGIIWWDSYIKVKVWNITFNLRYWFSVLIFIYFIFCALKRLTRRTDFVLIDMWARLTFQRLYHYRNSWRLIYLISLYRTSKVSTWTLQ